MVDEFHKVTDSNGPPKTFEEELAITFNLIEQLNSALEPEEESSMEDPPLKIYCKVCGKYMTETRCLYHLRAKGCHYCHLQTDLHKPSKKDTEL